MKVLIIDYGVGNHKSVANAFKFLGYDVMLSDDPQALLDADACVLPGVGAFGEAIGNLKRLGLADVIRDQALSAGKPLLGICLGMQLMADSSEEGGHFEGLGLIPGRVQKIKPQPGLLVPHVGWNNVSIAIKAPLFSMVDPDANFFFDHSYHFVCDQSYVAATCSYGGDVVAAVQSRNIFAAQFHPEKSQNNGLKLFRGFMRHVEQSQQRRKQVAVC